MWCSTPSCAEPARRQALGTAARFVLLMGAAGLAWANTGTPAADTPPPLSGSRLQGEATLRYFGLRVYHARLWTRADFRVQQAVEQPLLLELEYLRELQGGAIAERSLKEMRRGGSFSDAQAQRWLAEMQRIFPDVRAGDRLIGQHLPGQGARFWYNARPAGQIDDAEFARLFFGIWLAPTTSEPDMRLALLGLGDNGRR